MGSKIQPGLKLEDGYEQELKYLYWRLSTVNDLIRSLEEYDLLQPKFAQMPVREKTA
jgi:hypothetical protein